ncbi:MAG: TIM-barrel domain-containing protein [Bacilli bacterium]|jgi:alpha-glucosidase (family GH31 glycosyl hydrolase)
MYNLGEQFLLNQEQALANEKAIFKGKTYRITILTERLIRLEYNKDGYFEDRPTQLAFFRKFDVPPLAIKEDDKYLEVSSKYFKLEYTKERPFSTSRLIPGGNLRVSLLSTDRVWYQGHPEIRNYLGTNVSLEGMGHKIKLKKGLYSTDGFVSIDDSSSYVIEKDGTLLPRPKEIVDIYLFSYRKDFGLCLKDYFELTGKPPLIPKYALGNWWCRNNNYTEEDLIHLLGKFEKENVPLSVLLLDKDWHIRNYDKKKNLMTGFSFNKQLFPTPSEFIKKVQALNIKVGLNLDPKEGIYSHEEMYIKAASYLEQADNQTIPFAPLNPKFLETYFKILLRPLEGVGVDFFWNDYRPEKDLLPLWILNHYHFLDSDRLEARRGMLLGRNSLIGSHRYGVLYSGNTKVSWSTLGKLPFYNSTSSNIGISWWSHDIGGHHLGIEDGELYLRFVQLGTFSPIFRIHVDQGQYYKREPWRWNLQVSSIIKEYMQLRHRLLPYLYTEAYKYHKIGTPLIQPLYYKFPQIYDEPIYKNEYYLGSELMVSPLVFPKDQVMNRVVHKFYLPAGTWYDFKTGKKFPGNRSYVSFFRDQDYPVFARSGSIISLSNDIERNNISSPKNLEIHIFPGRSNTYKLYEDDGYTNLYKQGYYLLTSIDYNYRESNYTVIIRALEGKSGIVPKTRNYKIRFRNTKKTEDVLAYANDKKIGTTTYVDDNDFVIEIRDVPTIGQLAVNCKGKAIEIDAIRLINEDIDGIISDLPIETKLKEEISDILFGSLPIKKKRIEIKKLRRKKKLEDKFVRMFIRLLEYVEQI